MADTGIGIPEEERERIFERFYRVDKSRSREQSGQGGHGLGLSIAKWIAEAHHGKLLVTPNIGGGSIFTLFLPVK
ncbi:Alkaline phosphatase synthesis sensor protein PhoR [compost metagenome]